MPELHLLAEHHPDFFVARHGCHQNERVDGANGEGKKIRVVALLHLGFIPERHFGSPTPQPLTRRGR